MSSSSRLDVEGWKLWVFRLPCEAGLGDCTAEARLPGLPVLRQTGGGQAPSTPRSWVSRLGFRVSGLDSGLETRDYLSANSVLLWLNICAACANLPGVEKSRIRILLPPSMS